jgi:hypothetical protein
MSGMVKLTSKQWEEIDRMRKRRDTPVAVSLSSPMEGGTFAVAFDGKFVGYVRPNGTSTIGDPRY